MWGYTFILPCFFARPPGSPQKPDNSFEFNRMRNWAGLENFLKSRLTAFFFINITGSNDRGHGNLASVIAPTSPWLSMLSTVCCLPSSRSSLPGPSRRPGLQRRSGPGVRAFTPRWRQAFFSRTLAAIAYYKRGGKVEGQAGTARAGAPGPPRRLCLCLRASLTRAPRHLRPCRREQGVTARVS